MSETLMNGAPTSKVIVELSGCPDLGLVIKAATGAVYTNQAAGLGCLRPRAEGFFVPLRASVGRPELAAIQSLLRGAWRNLDEQQANALDVLLHRLGYTFIEVNRAPLQQSREAWVHVRVSAGGSDKVPLSAGAADVIDTVLIWPNSD